MNTVLIVSLIAAAAVGSVLTMAVMFPLLRKKGVNTQQVIDTAQQVLQTADTITDGLAEVLPGVPAIKIIDNIVDWAERGVTGAEQLYKSSQLDKDQRRDTAIDTVKSCLNAAGVEITPNIENIIDGAVEAAVFALPKSGTPTAA